MEARFESRFIGGSGFGGSGLSEIDESDSLSLSSPTRASHIGSGVSPLPPSYLNSSTQSRHVPSDLSLDVSPEVVVWPEHAVLGHRESEEPTAMDTSSE